MVRAGSTSTEGRDTHVFGESMIWEKSEEAALELFGKVYAEHLVGNAE